MADPIWSFLGVKKELVPSPPAITITGVRIPADGTPAHLTPLTTINTASTPAATDSFLFHIPDLRRFWGTKDGWLYRDIDRLDLRLQRHSPNIQEVQKEHHLQQWDYLMALEQERLAHPHDLLQRQRQRQNDSQVRHYVQGYPSSCVGIYYIFYSFDLDNLPRNTFVPSWFNSERQTWYGDVFLVKVAPYEYGGYGWALYEDIAPEFLDLLANGPSNS